MPSTSAPRSGSWTEVAPPFLRLGLTAFGGPAAHIAMMEEEFVRRRAWLSRDEFLDLVGATHLIPGPNSTELAIHIGHRRAGWPGLITAGVAFILPAFLIVTGLAWAYVRFGTLPNVASALVGLKPVIAAIVLQALLSLGRSAVRSRFLAAIGIAATSLGFAGVHELAVLFGAGILVAAIHSARSPKPILPDTPPAKFAFSAPVPTAAIATSGAAVTTATAAIASPVAYGLAPLFFFFLKVGSVLFGSGYVLLAFLRADLVDRWGWLTETQLVDAIAVGQFTPGPVFTTATFIGYLLGGVPGATVATIGIFLPAFFFVAISGPLVPRLRSSPAAGAFLDGVNVASLALMAVVTVQLARVAVFNGVTALLAGFSLVVLLRWKINSTWLLLAGAIAGLLAGSR